MDKQVLITGVCGFVGRYMCDYLTGLSEGPYIIGVDISGVRPSNCHSFYTADLTISEETKNVIKQTKPDFIIHFAGTFGTEDLQEIYKVNVLSIAALLESVREYVPYAVVVAAGSAAEYGQVEPNQLPVDEQTPCKPVTPYGLSKQLATQTALYYHRVHNICTMVVRPFQLIGNGITTRLAPGAFVEQIRKCIAQGSKVIKVGNLESWRDFLDVQDAVEAIWALCQKPTPGEIYNLCSGEPTKISDLLQMMIHQCGADVKIEVDTSRLNGRFDVPKIYGSCQKISDHCVWQPRRTLTQTIQTLFAC
jgi:GDP-4-dehydro-6-deoxy-D-mannose reductase